MDGKEVMEREQFRSWGNIAVSEDTDLLHGAESYLRS